MPECWVGGIPAARGLSAGNPDISGLPALVVGGLPHCMPAVKDDGLNPLVSVILILRAGMVPDFMSAIVTTPPEAVASYSPPLTLFNAVATSPAIDSGVLPLPQSTVTVFFPTVATAVPPSYLTMVSL